MLFHDFDMIPISGFQVTQVSLIITQVSRKWKIKSLAIQ